MTAEPLDPEDAKLVVLRHPLGHGTRRGPQRRSGA